MKVPSRFQPVAFTGKTTGSSTTAGTTSTTTTAAPTSERARSSGRGRATTTTTTEPTTTTLPPQTQTTTATTDTATDPVMNVFLSSTNAINPTMNVFLSTESTEAEAPTKASKFEMELQSLKERLRKLKGSAFLKKKMKKERHTSTTTEPKTTTIATPGTTITIPTTTTATVSEIQNDTEKNIEMLDVMIMQMTKFEALKGLELGNPKSTNPGKEIEEKIQTVYANQTFVGQSQGTGTSDYPTDTTALTSKIPEETTTTNNNNSPETTTMTGNNNNLAETFTTVDSNNINPDDTTTNTNPTETFTTISSTTSPEETTTHPYMTNFVDPHQIDSSDDEEYDNDKVFQELELPEEQEEQENHLTGELQTSASQIQIPR